jgi:DNA-directed RNA polymerase subunit K/omega
MEERKITKYEKARLIGSRALQLSMGAPIALKLTDEELASMNYSTIEIAKKEFEAGVIPMKILRPVKMERVETIVEKLAEVKKKPVEEINEELEKAAEEADIEADDED